MALYFQEGLGNQTLQVTLKVRGLETVVSRKVCRAQAGNAQSAWWLCLGEHANIWT